MKFASFLVFSCSLSMSCGMKRIEDIVARNGSSKTLSRNKRFLIFPPSTSTNTIKYVCGYLGPIDIPLWQNINCARNFQFQYDLPAEVRTSFPHFPGLGEKRSSSGGSSVNNKAEIKPDSSRKIAYEILEEVLNKENKNGHECVLRTICEVADTPLSHNGMIGELLQVFFTPGEHEIIDDEYRHAMRAGIHGVNCEKLFADCPFGILDNFSIIQNFHFDNVLNF